MNSFENSNFFEEKLKQERIKKIEELDIGARPKAEMMLVLLGEKPAMELGVYSWNSDPEEIERALEDSGLSCARKETKEGENGPKSVLVVTREEDELEELLNLDPSQDHEEYGRLMGYPESAIKAFKDKKFQLEEENYPDEEGVIFDFKLSRDNWREEWELLKRWSQIIKEYSPQTFEGLAGKKEEYTLPEDNLTALEEDSEIRKKNRDSFEGLKKEGIDWPLELQGEGRCDAEKREFLVSYPVGDKFASWAVVIHELGHLRQAGKYGREKLEEVEENNKDLEEEAWTEGWKKAREYCPEEIKELEKEFKNLGEQGKLSDFNSWGEYFEYIKEVSLKISKAAENLSSDIEPESEEYGREFVQELKKDPKVKKFLTEPENWKVDKKIDQKRAEAFIKKIARNIAQE